MKTSIDEISQTEKYLREELSGEESVVFRAKLIIDPELKANTIFHKMVHRMVALYYRKRLKAEVEAVHDRIFNGPSQSDFTNRILKIFNR
ncbi:MAG TPA: hypothetical protein VIQ51_08360 [Chryseosolibacter sp.]